MARKEKFTIAQVKKAIEGTGGLRSHIAERLECSYDTVLNYIARHPELQKAIKEEEEKVLDMAEGALYGLIQGGDTAAIFYYLNNKGKGRGYGYNPKLAALVEAEKGEEKKTGVLITPGLVQEDAWEKAASREAAKERPKKAAKSGVLENQ